MGFLNNSLAQLRDLFTSMTPAARITAALLLGVIVVSVGYLFQGYAGGGDEPLFGGEMLPPQEIARIEMAFAAKNLAILPRQAGRIMVPRGKKTEYLAAIAQAGAQPANFDTLLDESLDGGLMESGEKGKQRFKAARERQLSMMVGMMDGVEEAKVLYDVSEAKGFTKKKVTATVSLRPAPGADLTPQTIKTIRQAVAGAIANLDFQNVTVLNLKDLSRYGGGGGEITADSFDEPYFQARVKFEQVMKAKIEDVLHDIPGVRVQVSAELDPTLSTERRTIKTEGDPTPYRESTEDKTVTTAAATDRGPPGLEIQGPIPRAAQETATAATNQNTSTASDTDSFVPTANEVQVQAGLAPQRVRATITVPTEYLLRVYRERTPEADRTSPPELTKVEEDVTASILKAVTKLLPKDIAEANYPDVVVAYFQSLTPDAVEPPSMVSEGLMWANANSGSLVMAGLALVSLLMLRSMVKAIPPADPNIAFSSPILAAESRRAEQAATQNAAAPSNASTGKDVPRPRLRLKKGPTLKDDLSEMVREDPDGAAAVLRSWIGNAA